MSDIQKSLKINALVSPTLDMSSVEVIKRQFNEVSKSMTVHQAQSAARASAAGSPGSMGIPKSEDIQKARRELAAFNRELSREQEKLYGLFKQQSDKVE